MRRLMPHDYGEPCDCPSCEGKRAGEKIGKQLARDIVRILRKHGKKVTHPHPRRGR